MSTKMGFRRWALAGAAVVLLCSTASARVIDPHGITTNEAAALLVYEKLVVDPNVCSGSPFSPLGPRCTITGEPCVFDSDCPNTAGIDTTAQLTNTSEFLTSVKCWYINANGHCSNDPSEICTEANFRDVCPFGGLCVPGWQTTNFRMVLTKRQPVSWSVDEGLSSLPLSDTPGQQGQFNTGSIPPAPEIPFLGELRCVQLDVGTDSPTDRNDLKGEASIVTTNRRGIDVRKYNAIGIKAIEGRQVPPATTLNIGGREAEYGMIDPEDEEFPAACPNVWTLNHFFEGAPVETHNRTVVGEVHSEVTIVPCEVDFQTNGLQPITVQFLIYNEFEQRFSTSTKVTCFKETPLADIDTRPGPDGDPYSIFSLGTQGTFTGQSRVRSVAGPDVDGYDARGILMVLEEKWDSGICVIAGSGGDRGQALITLCDEDADCDKGEECEGDLRLRTDATNVQFDGKRRQGDRWQIVLP